MSTVLIQACHYGRIVKERRIKQLFPNLLLAAMSQFNKCPLISSFTKTLSDCAPVT